MRLTWHFSIRPDSSGNSVRLAGRTHHSPSTVVLAPVPAVSASTSSLLLDQLFSTGSSSSSLTRDLADVSSWRKAVHLCQASDSDCQASSGDMALLQHSKAAARAGCEPGCWLLGEETLLGEGHRCSQLSGCVVLQSPAQKGWGPPWQGMTTFPGRTTAADAAASS